MVALLTLCVGGCALRVPRIDPSGRSVFVPRSYTTIEPPSIPGLGHHQVLPEPAWSDPPEPPDCNEPIPPRPISDSSQPTREKCALIPRPHAARDGRMLMSVEKMVAAVGQEVVLRAGVCGPDGYLVSGQLVEWSITSDSVGQFIGVGDNGRSLLHGFTAPKPRKITSQFALTHSTTKGMLLTRGTRTPNDDTRIEKGQAWVTVSSPSEGVSYVTAVAPKTASWPERRRTAEIHWVDADWTLPPSVTVRAGTEHELVTRVTRSNGDPVRGWLVRYDVAAGPPAEFTAGGKTGQAIEVPTDSAGEARAIVRQLTGEAGVSRVGVEIARPAGRGEEVVGRGVTAVRWSAAGLDIQAFGPDVAEADALVTYRIEVRNRGDQPTDDITVVDRPSPRLRFVSSLPRPQTSTDERRWEIGSIPANTTRVIEANYRVEAGDEDIRYCARASGQAGVTKESCVTTSILSRALRVQLAGPDTADVGEEFSYIMNVTNEGSQTLQGVRVLVSFDPGLEHAEETSPVDRDIPGGLEPGKTEKLRITLSGRNPGRYCTRVEVTAAGGYRDADQQCINVRERRVDARPELALRFRGVASSRVDPDDDPDREDRDDALFYAIINNTGNVPLRDVDVAIAADRRTLEPKLATSDPPNSRDGDSVTWRIPVLDVGRSVRLEVVYNPIRVAQAATVSATVTAAGGLRDSNSLRIDIGPADRRGQAGPRDGGASVADPQADRGGRATGAAAGAGGGGLKVSIADNPGSQAIGKTVEYIVLITNQLDQDDQDVRLRLIIPTGMSYVRASGPTALHFDGGRFVETEAVKLLRKGEPLRPYIISLSGRQAGEQTVEVEVTSRNSPTAVKASETTRVYNQ
jgi:uncharacterized repeat protein (TIGR01451 family)